MILPGIIASSKLGIPPTAFDSIASATGTGSSGTITFASIPSTYKHLQLRCSSNDGAGYSLTMFFNNDTGSNYSWHSIIGTGSAVNATGQTANSSMRIVNEDGFTTNTNTVYITDVIDYANITKQKTIRTVGGRDGNGSGEIQLSSGLWNSTAAINRIDIAIGGNFTTTSKFALYGIRG